MGVELVANLFNDPIHINITVNTMATGLGQSSTSLTGTSYSNIRSYLLGDVKSAWQISRTVPA